jgi:hypothetical protein
MPTVRVLSRWTAGPHSDASQSEHLGLDALSGTHQLPDESD